MVWGADGWLRTLDGDGATDASRPPRRSCRAPVPGRAGARGLRRPGPADRFSVVALAVARRVVQPDGAPRSPAPVRARDDRAACSARRWSRGDSRRTVTAPHVVDFEPEHFQQMAGLICYYNGTKFHYLQSRTTRSLGRHLRVMSALPDHVQADAFTAPVAIPSGLPVQLRVEVDFERLYFGYRVEGTTGPGCRSSTPASCRTRPPRRACRISPAHLSAWPVRIWRGLPGRRISITSSTVERGYSVDPRAATPTLVAW